MPKKMTAESLVSFMASHVVTKARLAWHLGLSPAWVDSIILGIHRPGYGKVLVFSEESRSHHLARLEEGVRELVALDTEKGFTPTRHGPKPKPYAERLKKATDQAKRLEKRGVRERRERAAKKKARAEAEAEAKKEAAKKAARQASK
jgi:hypothetical protein